MMKTIFCTGGVNSDTPTELGFGDVFVVLEKMYEAISSDIKNERTDGIFCVVPPCVGVGLFDISNFVLIKDYPIPKVAVERELGSINGVRFVLEHTGKPTEKSKLGANVYELAVFCTSPYDYMFGDGYLKERFIGLDCPRFILKATTYYD